MITAKHNVVACALVWPVLLTLSSCATVRSGYESVKSGVTGLGGSDYEAWEGHPARDLLDSWGPPDETADLGPEYVAYTWLGADGECRRTFTSRGGTITGYSETDC